MLDPRDPFAPSWVESFKENPTFFALVAVAAAAGVALGIVALVLALKRSGIGIALGAVAALAGIAAIGLGAFGWSSQRHSTDHTIAAVSGLTAHEAERIHADGYQRAQYPLLFGGGAGALPLLLGAVSAGTALARREPR